MYLQLNLLQSNLAKVVFPVHGVPVIIRVSIRIEIRLKIYKNIVDSEYHYDILALHIYYIMVLRCNYFNMLNYRKV
jgi:hypothetical protein